MMEEFDKQSDTEVTQIDKDAEEELIEQLEDFETMRDNLSADEEEEQEEQDTTDVTLNTDTEKENLPKARKILKNASRRQIHTSEGAREKDFGIVGKGFNEG